MKTVYINNLGFLQGPSVIDAKIALEVTDHVAEKLSFWPAGKLWKYNEQLQDFELVTSFDPVELRRIRQTQCFTIINRGYLWYASLTEEQQEELRSWYQEWLDVTETGELPKKPEWLH